MGQLKRFLRGQDGSVTVEYVMWLPILFGFMMLTADATMLLQRQQILQDAARDASRQVALGLKTTAEAESEMVARFDTEDDTFTTNVAISGDYVTASISQPFGDVTIFADSLIGSGALSAEVTMWVEETP